MRLIDADALKDYIDEQDIRPFIALTVGEALKIMTDEQPTITPELHWIPVEQELPEYGKAVLTITQDETYEVNHVIDEEYGEWFWEDNGRVIAWMPLPEPFKEVT